MTRKQGSIGFKERAGLASFFNQIIVTTQWCHIAAPLKGGNNCTHLLKTAVSKKEIML